MTSIQWFDNIKDGNGMYELLWNDVQNPILGYIRENVLMDDRVYDNTYQKLRKMEVLKHFVLCLKIVKLKSYDFNRHFPET